MSGSESVRRRILQIGDVVVPTFEIQNPSQRDCRIEIQTIGQAIDFGPEVRTGRWIVVKRRGEA